MSSTLDSDHRDLVRLLLLERPSLHGPDAGSAVNWQLGDKLLRWLDTHLEQGAATLETGCGYSTLLFAARSASHTVVSPLAAEHDRVRHWCAEHDIATSHVRFACEASQTWLPRASAAGELGELDLILIDGDHAYPAAGIDWYYTAPALRVGGLLIVDDVSVRACGHLAGFLAGEQGRWEKVVRTADATVFRKLTADATTFRSWNQQPWNVRRPGPAEVVATVRNKVRLRSRLRDLGVPIGR